MNTPTPSEVKKIAIVGIIVFILIGLIVIGRMRKNTDDRKPFNKASGGQTTESRVQPTTHNPQPSPTLYPAPGKMILVASASSVKIGETLTVAVSFDAVGKVLAGADAIVKYNPVSLEASESLKMGSYFTTFPRKTVDNKAGVIKVTGFSPKDTAPLEKAATFFTITFTGKKIGLAKVGFEFTKGATNLSTLVEKGTGQNILGSTVETNIKVLP